VGPLALGAMRQADGHVHYSRAPTSPGGGRREASALWEDARAQRLLTEHGALERSNMETPWWITQRAPACPGLELGPENDSLHLFHKYAVPAIDNCALCWPVVSVSTLVLPTLRYQNGVKCSTHFLRCLRIIYSYILEKITTNTISP
jgi:hypothetical protein